jgi:hypothetical protein
MRGMGPCILAISNTQCSKYTIPPPTLSHFCSYTSIQYFSPTRSHFCLYVQFSPPTLSYFCSYIQFSTPTSPTSVPIHSDLLLHFTTFVPILNCPLPHFPNVCSHIQLSTPTFTHVYTYVENVHVRRSSP